MHCSRGNRWSHRRLRAATTYDHVENVHDSLNVMHTNSTAPGSHLGLTGLSEGCLEEAAANADAIVAAATRP